MADDVTMLPMGSSEQASPRQPPTVSDTTAAAFPSSTLVPYDDQQPLQISSLMCVVNVWVWIIPVCLCAFSALTQLVGRQEKHSGL